MTMENKNPFSEMIDSGYILSDDTTEFLLELAGIYDDKTDFYNKAKEISEKYDYEKRMHIILLYIDHTLTDNLISNEEFLFIQDIKNAFSIEKGDFYNKKFSDVQRILAIQYHLYYLDHRINFEESRETEYLKEIFDLDSTQMNSFVIGD